MTPSQNPDFIRFFELGHSCLAAGLPCNPAVNFQTYLPGARYLDLYCSKTIRTDSGGKEECTHAIFMTLSQNPDFIRFSKIPTDDIRKYQYIDTMKYLEYPSNEDIFKNNMSFEKSPKTQ